MLAGGRNGVRGEMGSENNLNLIYILTREKKSSLTLNFLNFTCRKVAQVGETNSLREQSEAYAGYFASESDALMPDNTF